MIYSNYFSDIEITWLKPGKFEFETNNSTYELKFAANSVYKLKNIEFFNNDKKFINYWISQFMPIIKRTKTSLSVAI